MQVDIDLKIFILVLLDNCPFYSINGGLKFGAGVDIEPVKIFGQCVQPIVASLYPIRIEYGHNFENKLVKKNPSLQGVLGKEI